MRNGRQLAAVAAAFVLAACEADALRPSPGFDAFLDRIGQVCYPDTIGPTLVREWAQGRGPGGGSAGSGFLDATSKLYYGKMDPLSYRKFITAFTDNGRATNKAIDCIVAQLPARPAGTGVPLGRDGVPPPPSR
jgi:hypothetical protein